MKIHSKNDQVAFVEKAFSSYVKSCLTYKSRNLFKVHDQESSQTQSLQETSEWILNKDNLDSNTFSFIDDKETLVELTRLLSAFEKKLLYLKFHEDKADWQIAGILGVSRQAVSKAKKKSLQKLKNNLDP
ncbi:sigma-70 family RNA polymerase sigma factor [Paenibacillus graminis]|uniref:RNA polymerase sigma-70 region 4 domain-containing protein n=1 Tax=Paenibacillus graminis TaxID=189425 RepID=A0A089MAM3_9BACL|nr:sigma-70 family RNA polymerase sigma factor [Paenibacillus graminis]AIQ70332.1 hypothetical protein PGRAT_23835 [Paenibacillus graminis]